MSDSLPLNFKLQSLLFSYRSPPIYILLPPTASLLSIKHAAAGWACRIALPLSGPSPQGLVPAVTLPTPAIFL